MSATETVRPLNAGDGLVGTGLRFAHRLTERADVKHSASVGANVEAVRFGIDVEDFQALDSGCGIEPSDQRTALIVPGVAVGGHHHSKSRLITPADRFELPIACRQERRYKI
jgi:hypothetical protein